MDVHHGPSALSTSVTDTRKEFGMQNRQDYIQFGSSVPIMLTPHEPGPMGGTPTTRVMDPDLYIKVRDILLARQLGMVPRGEAEGPVGWPRCGKSVVPARSRLPCLVTSSSSPTRVSRRLRENVGHTVRREANSVFSSGETTGTSCGTRLHISLERTTTTTSTPMSQLRVVWAGHALRENGRALCNGIQVRRIAGSALGPSQKCRTTLLG